MSSWRPICVPLLLLCLSCLSCGHEEPVGTLRIEALSGSAILLDGAPLADTTPVSLLLPVGTHTVAVERSDHETVPSRREVQVAPGRLVTAVFDLYPLGLLDVASDPVGAAIALDGAETGETTPHRFVLRVGTYAVTLWLDGYVDPDGPVAVDVVADAPVTVSRTLSPAGVLNVTSTPPGAAVRLDDVATGETTPHAFVVAAGPHEVSVSRDGFTVSPASLTVEVAADAEHAADFTLFATGTLGSLFVGSLPSGAAILIDGTDTGATTPHVFDLAAAGYAVELRREGFLSSSPAVADVAAGGETVFARTLAARKVVLLESVSNVSCVGCPALSDTLHRIELDGFAPPDVLYLKYSQSFPSPNDPHYLANPADNIARTQLFYWNRTAWNGGRWDGAMPSLFLDGDLDAAPAGNGYRHPWTALKDAIAARGAQDPGFAVLVAVEDYQAAELAVTVRLVGADAVGDAPAALHVVVVENPVLYDTPPGSEGETEFHWVMREFTTLAAAPLPLAADETGVYTLTVPRAAEWVAANLSVLAFVQRTDDLEILQAGYRGRESR